MAWLDDIADASFRGVPFFVDREKTRGGRRVANHQYPLRDQPYAEDLGHRQRTYTLDAYTLGDTAIRDRDTLITALETKGPGTLIHPTFGTMRLQVEDWSVSEDLIKEMRICRFDLTFVEPGDIAVPTVTADTSAQAGMAADTVTTTNQKTFVGSFMA
jgi:prophage DNA circulation protein